MDADQTTSIEWRAGDLPVSRRFGDPFFSLDDGLAETRHVFLRGNGLPERFGPGFEVAELGFGTGLNLLATWQAWRDSGQPGPLRFTSFEAYPLSLGETVRAHRPFAELADLSGELCALWGGAPGSVRGADLHLDLILGDARATLPAWPGRADAWFLDGFAPARNPELWEPDLLGEVARHTAPGGSAATYSAAGGVRRALGAAGFAVARVPGFGRKRHMTRARLERAP